MDLSPCCFGPPSLFFNGLCGRCSRLTGFYFNWLDFSTNSTFIAPDVIPADYFGGIILYPLKRMTYTGVSVWHMGCRSGGRTCHPLIKTVVVVQLLAARVCVPNILEQHINPKLLFVVFPGGWKLDRKQRKTLKKVNEESWMLYTTFSIRVEQNQPHYHLHI